MFAVPPFHVSVSLAKTFSGIPEFLKILLIRMPGVNRPDD